MSPKTKTIDDAADDARQLPGGLDQSRRQAGADAREQAEEDADAAEGRRVVLVPTVAGRVWRRTGVASADRSSAQIVSAATGSATMAAMALIVQKR